MKVFVIISVLFAVTSAEFFEGCSREVGRACNPGAAESTKELANCNALTGTFSKDNVMVADLQAYVNGQIEASFDFLLMSSHFGNYQANRDGFKSLYRKLSDKAWDDALDLVKYIAKRGGEMNFKQQPKLKINDEPIHLSELNEIKSLAKALSTQKALTQESMRIHGEALAHNIKDGSVSHYMEERFIEPQVETIRNLAGHITDLRLLINEHNSAAISMFIFDEYLQKTV